MLNDHSSEQDLYSCENCLHGREAGPVLEDPRFFSRQCLEVFVIRNIVTVEKQLSKRSTGRGLQRVYKTVDKYHGSVRSLINSV